MTEYPVALSYFRPGEVKAKLNDQRRSLRFWTSLLWIFAMGTVGAIMFVARVLTGVEELRWIAAHLPLIAQVSMGLIGFFGIQAVFGSRRKDR